MRHYINEDKGFSAFCLLFAWVAVLAWVAGSVVSYIEPLAAGSGIPELKTYLNGVHLPGLLRLQTIVSKLGGIVFTISSGLIAGKEGPFVHGGGIVGSGISQMASTAFNWGNKSFNYFRSEHEHRDFTTIGTAAGVATAFGAPIGGILFAIEEGSSYYSTGVLWRAFLSTCMGVVMLNFLDLVKDSIANRSSFLTGHLGISRDFGLYTDAVALYSQEYWWFVWEIPVFAFIGVLGGILGVIFVKLNLQVMNLRARFIPGSHKHKRMFEVVFLALFTSSIFFVVTYGSSCRRVPDYIEKLTNNFSGNDRTMGLSDIDFQSLVDEAQQEADKYPQLFCNNDNEYSEYGQLFFSPLNSALKTILHLGENHPRLAYYAGYIDSDSVHDFFLRYDNLFTYKVLVAFFFVLFVLMTITYGVGAPQGLFVPSLATGAALGRITGMIFQQIVKQIDDGVVIDVETYTAVGAAAVLGGATRMTISITVLAMETTGAMQLLAPFMICIFVGMP